jgi:hypothetical protein
MKKIDDLRSELKNLVDYQVIRMKIEHSKFLWNALPGAVAFAIVIIFVFIMVAGCASPAPADPCPCATDKVTPVWECDCFWDGKPEGHL